METTLFDFLLGLHIAGGAVGLLAGTVTMIRTKGDHLHRKTGRMFYFGMLTAGISSLILAYLHRGQFLFIVGVFTLYMLLTGYRYLRLKGLAMGKTKASWMDWGLSLTMILFGLIFFILGGINFTKGNSFGVVLFVLGGIGLSMALGDMRFYRGKITSNTFWLRGHIAKMCGTYIASFTAFLVVNIHFLPPVFIWLLPTAVITPLIVRWSRKYKTV